MVLVEKSFPRGGTVKQNIKDEPKKKIAFGARQQKRKNKSEAKKNKNTDNNDGGIQLNENLEAVSAELLTCKTIQEGMIVLCCVIEIFPTELKVILPGRLIGKVSAASISDSYNKVLSRAIENDGAEKSFTSLNEIFNIGENIYAKVVELKTIETGKIEINLSVKPKDVHSNMHHKDIKKGMILNGAVMEIEEHGYVIETGIRNLRCFLPFKKILKKYNVGQLICVKINKITQDSTASTAICIESVSKLRKLKDLDDPKIDYLLPTFTVHFTITKILKNGLQGTIMNGNFTAYVNEYHLSEEVTSVPTDFKVNSTHSARILYVMPITKLIYLSLILNNNESVEEVPYKKGDVIENAVVDRVGTGGIIVILDERYKGLISFKTIKSKFVLNYDQDELLSKYYKKSKHKVRIIAYDPIEHLYVCTNDPSEVNETYYTLSDLKIGEIVTGNVEKKMPNGNYYLKIGKVSGFIEKIYLSPTTGNLSENSKLRCRVISINTTKNSVSLTNRPEYLSKDAKILKNYKAAKENKIFLGTVVKTDENYTLVKFFNNIKGILYKSRMKKETSTYHTGQTTLFRIAVCNGEKIVLGELEDAFKLGEIRSGKVTHVIQDGLDVTFEDESYLKTLVSARFLSEYPELVTLMLKSFHVGDELEVVCVAKNTFSKRDVEYFKENPIKTWNEIEIGDIIRGYIKDIKDGIMEVHLPIIGLHIPIEIPMNLFLLNVNEYANIELSAQQIVYVKVLNKSKIQNVKTLKVSAKLTDVWDGNLKQTSEMFVNYLKELNAIRKSLKDKNRPLGQLQLGQVHTAEIITHDEENKHYVLKLSNGVLGIVKDSIISKEKLSTGKSINCAVLWIDYLNELVYLSPSSSDLQRIAKDQTLPENLKQKVGLNAKILLVLNDLIVCSLKKGRNPLMLIPRKLHFNDFESNTSMSAKEGEFCRLAIIHETHPIAVFESTWKLWNEIKGKKRKHPDTVALLPSNKTQLSQDGEKIRPSVTMKFSPLIRALSEESNESSEDETHPQPPKKQKKENKSVLQSEKEQEGFLSTPSKKGKKEFSQTKPNPPETKSFLPGPSNFWTSDLQTINSNQKIEDSSDDEDMENSIESNRRKNKKMTQAEKLQAAREEEARIREIEEKYANPNSQPETADQFERLVLSSPNDSKNWINYMVFHLQATEIDKARVIARKALKSISFREEEELINIWVALLNLELRYGTKDTFTDVLKESVLCNDSYKIHTRVLKILSDAKKIPELSDLIWTCTRKFKDQPEMWKNAAIAYFEVGLPEKAKQLLHKALTILPEREHVNTIVAFAILNHKYGDKETAHALLEQIITSYPKRVDVWSQYVDMLIKDQDYESARRTLDRAAAQKIPLKKMRTIFKKYLEFEEKHGTEENVLRVKEMAANYVQRELNPE